MLEFLERKKNRNKEQDEGNGLVCEVSAHAVRKEKLDQAESFIRKNIYNGTSLPQYSMKCLSHLAKEKEISQGAFFVADEKDGKPVIRFVSGFASPDPEGINILEIGEGFPGQVAKDGKLMNISDIPEGYLMIESGLGKASPVSLLVFPVKNGDDVLAVIEVSSFKRFTDEDEHFFNKISHSIAEQIMKCKN